MLIHPCKGVPTAVTSIYCFTLTAGGTTQSNPNSLGGNVQLQATGGDITLVSSGKPNVLDIRNSIVK